MAELKVVIDKVLIHDALKEAIQKIATDHGLMITDIDIGWDELFGTPPTIKYFEVRTRS